MLRSCPWRNLRNFPLIVIRGQTRGFQGHPAVHFLFDQTRVAVTLRDAGALRTAVASCLKASKGFALATINLDHLVKLRASERFRRIYALQDMVVADGNPIVWLSRLAGRPVALVPGSDMVIPLARLARDAGVSVALVGTTARALDAAAACLVAELPGLTIAACVAPPAGFDPESPLAAKILENLATLQVGLCFVALGAPKQEAFAARGRTLAPQVGFASIGAGIDFLSGDQIRAPEWVRSIAMEWMWRTLTDPRRMIPRYAACFRILPGLALEALRSRRG